MKATRESWKAIDMPAERTKLPFGRTFSQAEYDRVALGFVPRSMEDKWFIYSGKNRVYFHRSWSHHCIYELHLQQLKNGAKVIEAWVNRNPERYRFRNDDYDVKLLAFIIDRLLLSYDFPFPVPEGLPSAQVPLHQHNLVGYGRSNTESK
jgi:hypothetical protein